MGGGGFPPPRLSRYFRHFCAENSLSFPPLLMPDPYTPRLGISAVPLWLEIASNTSEAIHIRLGYPTALSPLSPCRAGSSNTLPANPRPCTRHCLDTVLIPYFLLGTLVPPPSPAVHMMPPTGYLLPGRGSRLS